MAKNKKRKAPAKTVVTPKKPAVSAQTIKIIDTSLKEVKTLAKAEGVTILQPTPEVKTIEVTPALLNKAFTDANVVKGTYKRLEEKLLLMELELDEREANLATREKSFDSKDKKAEVELKKATQLSNEMADKERKNEEETAKIEAGYAEKNWDALTTLRETKDKILKTIEDSYTEHSSKIQEFVKQAAGEYESIAHLSSEIQKTITDHIQGELKQMLEKVGEERTALAEIERERFNLKVDQDLLEEDRAAFEEKLESRYVSRSSEDKAIISRLEKIIDARDVRIEELHFELAQLKSSMTAFGDLTPKESLDHYIKMKEKVETLSLQVNMGHPEAEIERLFAVEGLYKNLIDKHESLIRENTELKHTEALSMKTVSELEARKSDIEGQKLMADLYKQQNSELKKEYGKILEKSNASNSFEKLSKYDDDKVLQSNCDTETNLGSLKDFAEDLRNRMALNSGKRDVTLYYSPEDVRIFIAGLAMSPLHILQGISGTGKTSLARAFAESVGAGYTLVPAQAGWRDRYDLIGHFNSFSKKYQETPFLKGLYKAQTPYFSDKLYIILIDEMNLSRFEHYGADIISLLETGDEEKGLEIRWTPQGVIPDLFIGEDDHIEIPKNVWFIGTANHDETTVEFADKTYDRSHVMELPSHPSSFKVIEPKPRMPVSFDSLQSLFSEAREKFSLEAKMANDYLESSIRGPMQEIFNIGWGNRLLRHIEQFVPTLVASGGTVSEAVDHLIATKLLRKVRNQHTVKKEGLEKMRDVIESSWIKIDKTGLPIQSSTLLDNKIKDPSGSF